MALAYVRFGADKPHLYRLMFSADARSPVHANLDERAAAALDVLTAVISDGQRCGWLHTREIKAQATACWAQLHGLTLLTLDGLLTLERAGPAAQDAAFSILLGGLDGVRLWASRRGRTRPVIASPAAGGWIRRTPAWR